MKVARKLRRVEIREEFVMLTGDLQKAALLLWIVNAAYEPRAVDGWIADSSVCIAEEMLGALTNRTIQRYMTELVARGWVQRQAKPGNILLHKPNIEAIMADLNAIGCGLDGFAWEDSDSNREGAQAKPAQPPLLHAEESAVTGPQNGVLNGAEEGLRQNVGGLRQNVAHTSLLDNSDIGIDRTRLNRNERKEIDKDNSNNRARARSTKGTGSQGELPEWDKPRPHLAGVGVTTEPDPIALMFRLFTERFRVECRGQVAQQKWEGEFERVLELVSGDVERAIRVYGYAYDALIESGKTTGTQYTIAGPSSLWNAVVNLGDINQTIGEQVWEYPDPDNPYLGVPVGFRTKLRYA